ncbi:hypothetical protein GGF32_000543, partial [Allomyces javanicus]
MKSYLWYLVLALRDNNRAPVLQPQPMIAQEELSVRSSRQWSLLPVPFRQICDFYIYFNDCGRNEYRDEDDD